MRRFGQWLFDRDLLILTCQLPDSHGYEIDLETMTTSAEVLDWIFQIRSKTWASPQVISDLLDAIQSLINPQANVCSWGKDDGIDQARASMVDQL